MGERGGGGRGGRGDCEVWRKDGNKSGVEEERGKGQRGGR